MQEKIRAIRELYRSWKGEDPQDIEMIAQSGSERKYFRLYDRLPSANADASTVIGTYGANIKENETFVYFSHSFKQKGLAVPEVYCVSADKYFYLQEDVGRISLLDKLEEQGYTDESYALFRDSLHQLARLQIKGDEGLNYNFCLTNKEFGKQAIMADLLYFKYYFLDTLKKPYDKQKLIDDFEALSSYLTHAEFKYFMFRDFQSRNILLASSNSPSLRGAGTAGTKFGGEAKEGESKAVIHFIDYQGGMKGAPHYDVASLLWQARAGLPEEWKNNLLEEYMNFFEDQAGLEIDRTTFRSQYNGYVLIRLLQVLGAYGFNGLFDRKAHFLTSIPMALKNLKWFFENQHLGITVPEFRKILEFCISDEVIEQFTPLQANEQTPLVINISSFSYKQGIPEVDPGHGGGFVFDCRGIENPGRIQQFKTMHGRDKDVKDFLEQETRMNEFLNSVFDIVDISVDNYLRRGFESLSVHFGCTGGQHRSVYAADALARHLRNKYKVKIELKHIEQEKKNWQNTLPEKSS
jgi:RNase adapter protein RapZ